MVSHCIDLLILSEEFVSQRFLVLRVQEMFKINEVGARFTS